VRSGRIIGGWDLSNIATLSTHVMHNVDLPRSLVPAGQRDVVQVERRVAELATRQGGIVSRAQLAALGLGR
jgi:hypothetical protein